MTHRYRRLLSDFGLVFASCIAVTLSSPAFGQVPDEPRVEVDRREVIQPVLINDVELAKTALHPLRPFVERSTFLAIDLSLADIDTTSTTAWLKQHLGVQAAPIDFISTLVDGNLQQLRSSGADHLYVLVSTRIASDQAPLIVIPCQNPAPVKTLLDALASTIPQNMNLVSEAREQVVLLGPKQVLERVRAEPDKPDPSRVFQADQLLARLVAPDALSHRMVLVLPKEAREELSTLWPETMPDASPIKFSPRQLAADLSSLTVSWQLPPEVAMQIDIQAVNAADAKDRLLKITQDAIALLSDGAQNIKLTTQGTKINLAADSSTMLTFSRQLVAPMRETASRQRSISNAKQIMLALHNYHDKHKHFPPAAITDESGKAVLSWRVAILPFMEQQALYDQFKLDEPWDSPHNLKLLSKMPAAYGDGQSTADSGKTRFRLPAITGGAWGSRNEPLTFKAITDGTADTIAVVQTPPDAAVEWTRPETFVVDEGDSLAKLFGDSKQIIAATFDGSVYTLAREQLDDKKLRVLLTIAGKEITDWWVR